MVGVTLAAHIRVGGKDHVRLKVSYDFCQSLDQLLLLVESAIAETQKAQILYAKHTGGSPGLFHADGDQVRRRSPCWRVCKAVAPVDADHKANPLSKGCKLGCGRTCADLNIIRVRSDEEKTLKRFQVRQGGGKAKDGFRQAHASTAFFLFSSSSQMRSYSSSSSL